MADASPHHLLPVLQAMITPRSAPRLLANHLADWDIHDLWQWVKANPTAVAEAAADG